MGKIRKRRSFEESANDYAKYCNEDGYLAMSFVTPEGYHIGHWGHNVRQGRIKITAERREKLEEIHFLWNASEYCEKKRKRKMEDFQQEKKPKIRRKTFEEWLAIFDDWNVDGYIPVEFATPQGEKVGRWAAEIRYSQRKITKQQREKLDKRNFCWKVENEGSQKMRTFRMSEKILSEWQFF